jgi:putative oxidoreductase
MKYLALLGRICFSAIFILSSFSHFKDDKTLAYAARAGAPAVPLLVPLSGALILLGGLSVLLGYRARVGAWLIVLFLVPVTLIMHRFWGLPDPQAAMEQRINFMKNLSMLGGALLIAYFGAGPLSLDERRKTRL